MPLKYSYRLYHLIGRIQRVCEKIGTYLDVDKFQKFAAHGALTTLDPELSMHRCGCKNDDMLCLAG